MKWIVALLFLALGACSTTPKKETVSVPQLPKETSEAAPTTPSIDYFAIQRSLNMERPVEQLGYTEKAFNTCQMGYGYSRSQDCRNLYFVVLNVRLLCRDTEGTISTVLTESDVTPIAGRNLKWSLKSAQGTILTDGLGYGQIITVAPRSERRERIKLSLGSEFLYMRANEITKVITPKPWCDQY